MAIDQTPTVQSPAPCGSPPASLAPSLVQVSRAPIATPAVSVLVAVLSTVPLAWRRTQPALAALVGTLAWLVPTPGGYLLVGYLVSVVLFYSLGAHDPDLRR